MIDTDTAGTDPKILRAQTATATMFLLFGVSLGLWLIHIPIIVSRIGLSPSQLGLTIMLVGVGSLLFQPVAARIAMQIGSGAAARILAPIFLILVMIPPNAPNIYVLFGVALPLGAAAGGLNVSMNAQGSMVEKARGKPVLSMFHGFFSLGTLVAASLGSLLIWLGLDDGGAVILVNFVALAITTFSSRHFLPNKADPKPSGKRFAFPKGGILLIALMAFLSNTVEFAVNDWSALFMVQVKQADPALAGLGLGAFALAMTIMRFAGGPMVSRLGPKRMLFLGGVLTCLGMSIAILSPVAYVSALGFLIVGIGAANLAPLLMSAASRYPGIAPETGVAMVATALTTGILIGPAALGFVADLTSLSHALGIAAINGLIIAVLAFVRDWSTTSDSVAAK